MGQNNSVQFLKFSALAVVVIAFGTAIGYYVLGGAHDSHTVSTIPTTTSSSTPTDTTVSQPTSKSVAALRPHNSNGDYTAPGAPHIHIAEEKPSLTDESHSNSDTAKTSDSQDSEASQEATAPAPSDTTSSPASGAPADNSTADTPPDNSASAPSDNAAAGSDSDYEKTTVHADTEASQQGADSGRPLYRVQIGAFGAAKNARILADALKAQGYNAGTRMEHDGDKTVYKVQAGAYRTKAAAGKAALELQRNGYPAYVSPATP